MSVSLPDGDPTTALPFAFGGPPLRGRLRIRPEDFLVDEILGYQASGDGEHAFLKVRKRGRNTQEVARVLARHADVAQVAVGYAGLKDRNAITVQHFSVQLPGRESPDWSALEDDTLQILSAERHHRKIRRGSLRGNRFTISVQGVSGDRDRAEQRLAEIRHRGVPNYFGSQRFGHQGQNLPRVADLFAARGRRPGREQKGLLLSAARSQLFNVLLANRVRQKSWDKALAGDVMLLAGSQRQFMFDPDDETIAERLGQLDVHPTGPMCGRHSRALTAEAEAGNLETDALHSWAEWIDGLQRFGLDADRRALRLGVPELQWVWRDDALQLQFELVSGAYATAVLRELVDIREAEQPTT